MHWESIPRPTAADVKSAIENWDSSDEDIRKEAALEWLFSKYSKNVDINVVLTKCALLNLLYSTRVDNQDLLDVAQTIVDNKIDERLTQGDERLVDDLADKMEKCPSGKRYLSFVSKYCSFHNSEDFPIYDSYVAGALWSLQKKFKYNEMTQTDFKNYTKHKSAVIAFRSQFGLESFNFKQLDHFLQNLGKDNDCKLP